MRIIESIGVLTTEVSHEKISSRPLKMGPWNEYISRVCGEWGRFKLTGRVEESLTGEFLFKINIRVPFQRLECFSFFWWQLVFGSSKYLSRVTDGSTCAIHFAFNVMRMWFRHFALDSDLFVEVEIEIRTKIAPMENVQNQWKMYKWDDIFYLWNPSH